MYAEEPVNTVGGAWSLAYEVLLEISKTFKVQESEVEQFIRNRLVMLFVLFRKKWASIKDSEDHANSVELGVAKKGDLSLC